MKKNLKRLSLIMDIVLKYILALIIAMLVLITIIMVFNIYPAESILMQNILLTLLSLLTITIVIMIYSLLVNVVDRNHSETMIHTFQKQFETQIHYYEKLEQNNNETRAFKHDYVNHMNSVSDLLRQKQYEAAEEYLNVMIERKPLNEELYYTGNQLANAILTDKSEICREFADIDFEGIITDKIENIDMCTILSNALDNAIEACRKCEGRSVIEVSARIMQGYFRLIVKNPTVNERFSGDLPSTTKEDRVNHGFGLMSIERTVKKYDGSMSTEIRDMHFVLTIVMKI